MVLVYIDEFTPCLIDSKTGELVNTECVRVVRKSFLKKYSKKNGWYVDWDILLNVAEIYAIVIEGSVDIQGLVAVHPDIDSKTAFVDWMCAAPHNNPELTDNKKFVGIGGHLFAIAAQKSIDYGFGGAISGFAANQRLLDHYCKRLSAEPICMLHPYQFFIDESDGKELIEVYNYDWTSEKI